MTGEALRDFTELDRRGLEFFGDPGVLRGHGIVVIQSTSTGETVSVNLDTGVSLTSYRIREKAKRGQLFTKSELDLLKKTIV